VEKWPQGDREDFPFPPKKGGEKKYSLVSSARLRKDRKEEEGYGRRREGEEVSGEEISKGRKKREVGKKEKGGGKRKKRTLRGRRKRRNLRNVTPPLYGRKHQPLT